jgi:hypothetical protein
MGRPRRGLRRLRRLRGIAPRRTSDGLDDRNDHRHQLSDDPYVVQELVLQIQVFDADQGLSLCERGGINLPNRLIVAHSSEADQTVAFVQMKVAIQWPERQLASERRSGKSPAICPSRRLRFDNSFGV